MPLNTALAAYLLDPAGSDYSLSRLAAQYLAAPLDGESLAQQAAAIWRLQAPLRAQLADQGMLDLLLQLELPLCRVLAQMERVGVAVDEAALVAFGQMLQGEIDRSSGEVYRYAGGEFNINSPKKLGQILFEQLELPASFFFSTFILLFHGGRPVRLRVTACFVMAGCIGAITHLFLDTV